jgi:hypothetical protein
MAQKIFVDTAATNWYDFLPVKPQTDNIYDQYGSATRDPKRDNK